MGAMSPTHWLIVIGVVVLLFGAKRLPDAARSLGRSARILKAEVKDMNGDAAATDEQAPAALTPQSPAVGPSVAQPSATEQPATVRAER